MRHRLLGGLSAAWLATAAQAIPGEALPAGIYQGRYVCPQGETAVALTVGDPAGGLQSAEFSFGGNDGLPSGAYFVLIQVERGGDIVLIPQQWTLKADGYQMVGARLRRDGDQLGGTITNSACRAITLHRVDPLEGQ